MRSALVFSMVLTACASNGTPSSDAGVASVDASSSVDTWDNYAAGFFTSYCVECHDTKDSVGRDYTQEAKVQGEKNEIRCGVAIAQDPSWACKSFPPARQFPIGNGAKPSDADRARLVAWISAGAP